MIKLSECEEQVMAIIWNSEEELDAKQIRKEANACFNHEWAQQTVGTYIGRLVKKEYLLMKRKGRKVYYESLVDVAVYRKKKLQSLVEVLYAGDMEGVKEDLK